MWRAGLVRRADRAPEEAAVPLVDPEEVARLALPEGQLSVLRVPAWAVCPEGREQAGTGKAAARLGFAAEQGRLVVGVPGTEDP